MSDDHRWALIYAAALTVAVGALAGVLARMTLLVPMAWSASTVEARIAEVLVGISILGVTAATIAAFTVVPMYGTSSDRIGSGEVPWLVFLVLGAVVLFGLGFVGVQPFAGGFADATTEARAGWGGPAAEFTATERTTGDGERILTITHAGGEPVLAAAVTLRGEGFVAVEGVDQVEPGQWRGTVSGERPRRGGRAIVEGDAVEVGVDDDCEIALRYEHDDYDVTKFYYECGRSRSRD